MLNETDFFQWSKRLGLSEQAQAVVKEVRSQNPTRRVGGGRNNVSGRYPTRKMGVTIQFESHRIELPFVYGFEHDATVLEYDDQTTVDSTLLPGGQWPQALGVTHAGLLCHS